MGEMVLGERPVAEVCLAVLLLQSVVIAGGLILLLLLRVRRHGWRGAHPWQLIIYFAGIGLGFILVEMALLGRFVLFLGQPIYAYAAVLATLLIFTGIGSRCSTNLLEESLFTLALGWPLAARLALSVGILAPLGMILGIPFPSGLRMIAQLSTSLLPWAWGINSFFTVIGTILASILGVTFGFDSVLLLGGASYLLALCAISFRHFGMSERPGRIDQATAIPACSPGRVISALAHFTVEQHISSCRHFRCRYAIRSAICASLRRPLKAGIVPLP